MNAFRLAEQYGPLLGRVLLMMLFIISGVHKITGFEGTAGYMASKGLPMPSVLLIIAAIVELGGALLIVLGWHARWGALAIFLYVIPVTLVFHPFWAVEGQLWAFWKNIALMGAMLYIMAYGPGPISVDKARR
ncbi:MAG: DoxX family protein [Acidiferrobacterales bacterium]